MTYVSPTLRPPRPCLTSSGCSIHALVSHLRWLQSQGLQGFPPCSQWVWLHPHRKKSIPEVFHMPVVPKVMGKRTLQTGWELGEQGFDKQEEIPQRSQVLLFWAQSFLLFRSYSMYQHSGAQLIIEIALCRAFLKNIFTQSHCVRWLTWNSPSIQREQGIDKLNSYTWLWIKIGAFAASGAFWGVLFAFK